MIIPFRNPLRIEDFVIQALSENPVAGSPALTLSRGERAFFCLEKMAKQTMLLLSSMQPGEKRVARISSGFQSVPRAREIQGAATYTRDAAYLRAESVSKASRVYGGHRDPDSECSVRYCSA